MGLFFLEIDATALWLYDAGDATKAVSSYVDPCKQWRCCCQPTRVEIEIWSTQAELK
jgi:hypothetical protein